MNTEPIGETSTERVAYNGTVKSPSLSGEAELFIDTDGLSVEMLLDGIAVPYAEIESITLDDYIVQIQTRNGNLQISQMGSNCEGFFLELCQGFNQKVLAVLQVEGPQILETKGLYKYCNKQGKAQLGVYRDYLCILPANKDGRRIPLIFVSSIKSEDYVLSLTLTTGESYEFSMLGYDLDPLEKAITAAIRNLWENNKAFVARIDEKLGFAKISQAARLLPEGIAAPLAGLSQAFPTLTAALEKKMYHSKMNDTYPVLKTICNEEKLCLGIKSVPEKEAEELLQTCIAGVDDGDTPPQLTPEQMDSLRWILWAAIPSKNENAAVVEFAFPNEKAATYIFRLDNSFDCFLQLLNRALEATGLQREAIYLSDVELLKDQHADIRMLLDRTPALRELRRCFVGRAIHRGMDNWRNSVLQFIKHY